MTAQLIDGKAIADQIYEEIQAEDKKYLTDLAQEGKAE